MYSQESKQAVFLAFSEKENRAQVVDFRQMTPLRVVQLTKREFTISGSIKQC